MMLLQISRRLLAGSIGVALCASLTAAPSPAQTGTTTTTTTTTTRSNVVISRVRYPARVTTINGDTVVIDANGQPVTLQRGWATYEYNGQPVEYGTLQPGQRIMVVYPEFNGNVSAYNGNMLMVTDSNGNSYMVPRNAINQQMYGNLVYVRLADGRYVMVPLNRAIRLQDRHGATIVSALPDGTAVSPYNENDVMRGRNRDINFSEGVRIQKDPSRLIQDPSMGDSNF